MTLKNLALFSFQQEIQPRNQSADAVELGTIVLAMEPRKSVE